VLVAVLVPLAALAAANDWWFLRFGGTPVPTEAPQVVKEGEWDGRRWELIAYPSRTDGLCISMTPKGSRERGEGAAMSCASFAGIARPPETKASPAMTITYLAGGATAKLPAYITGAVVAEASTVEIRFRNGDVLQLPTFPGPEPLDHIRFYAAQLPSAVGMRLGRSGGFPEWIAGLDSNGNVVTCLAPETAMDGVSPLSDCR
jgi:hypothetical protein